MLYKDIEAALAALANDVERLLKLSSVTGDEAVGIVDGASGTDCDKNYWERQLGLYDVVLALYNIWSGRDDFSGGTTIKIGATEFGPANQNINGQFLVTGAASFNTGVWTHGDSTSQFYGDTAFFKMSNFQAGLKSLDSLGYDLVSAEATTPEVTQWDNYNIISTAAWDLLFSLPDTLATYDALGYGGAFKFGTLNDIAACINANGRLSLGNLGEDSPTDSAGVYIQARDARSSNGYVDFQGKSIASDDRITLTTALSSLLQHSTNPSSLQLFTMVTDKTSTASEWKFITNGVSVCIVDGYGDLWAARDATFDRDIHVGGNSTLDGTVDIGGNTDIVGTLHTTDDISTDLQIHAVGSIDSNIQCRGGTVSEHALIGFIAGNVYLELKNASATSNFGILPSLDSTALLLACGYQRLRFTRGAYATPTGTLDLELSEPSELNRCTITFGKTGVATLRRLFPDENGVVCTTESSGVVGAEDTGADIGKGDLTVPVDITSSAALNAHCANYSETKTLARVYVKHSIDGFIYQCVYEGPNWAVVK